jgi:hypothetical protein
LPSPDGASRALYSQEITKRNIERAMTWTPERRARQRELIKTVATLRKTSGPKTAAGKT